MKEEEDLLIFAAVPLSVVTRNYVHPKGGFVHETYSTARKISTGIAKVITTRVSRKQLQRSDGSLRVVRGFGGWEDVTIDEHHIYDTEDALGGRKGLG